LVDYFQLNLERVNNKGLSQSLKSRKKTES
jgi:hypothetical protein